MSAATVYSGLAERLRAVAGLQAVVLGEPDSVQTLPMVYTALQLFDREYKGQIVAMRYTFVHRLLLAWQDTDSAEAELLDLVNRVCIAIDDDPQLDGRLGSGLARIVRGPTGFVTIAGVVYRFCDFTSEVLEKGPSGTL